LANFISSKENRGFTVYLVTEESWGGGTGDTAAENIRNWLINNYLSLSLQYVLLIGNPHPGIGDVPMKMLWPRKNVWDWPECDRSPSDTYYADLTGNWDLDGDGYYGEWVHQSGPEWGTGDFGDGGVDLNFELTVGRIPFYGNFSKLNKILVKIIAYENELPDEIDWRKNALLAMKPTDQHTPNYDLGEEILANILAPSAWWYHRVYEEDYGLSPPPETIPCTIDNVTNAWTSSEFGVVSWVTHGSSTYAEDIMNVSHVNYLNDDYPGFLFQCSCHNAYPEYSNNLAYALLNNGAISTIAATRETWDNWGETSYVGSTSNKGMTYEYLKRLISNGMESGVALFDMKQTLIP
jgi:hypothetical protein